MTVPLLVFKILSCKNLPVILVSRNAMQLILSAPSLHIYIMKRSFITKQAKNWWLLNTKKPQKKVILDEMVLKFEKVYEIRKTVKHGWKYWKINISAAKIFAVNET